MGTLALPGEGYKVSFLYLQVFHFSETAYNWLQEMASAEERDEEGKIRNTVILSKLHLVTKRVLAPNQILAQEYHVDLSILEDKGHWKSFLNLGLCVDEESECLMRYERLTLLFSHARLLLGSLEFNSTHPFSGVKCLEDAKLKESGELFLTNLRLAFRGSKSKGNSQPRAHRR